MDEFESRRIMGDWELFKTTIQERPHFARDLIDAAAQEKDAEGAGYSEDAAIYYLLGAVMGFLSGRYNGMTVKSWSDSMWENHKELFIDTKPSDFLGKRKVYGIAE